MKRIICSILFAFFCAWYSYAQEHSIWEFVTNEANSLKAGTEAPIDVTKEKSEMAMKYRSSQTELSKGDCISRLSFRGYNPGKDIRRHLKVWMRNDDTMYERDIKTDDVSKMTCVFDGDCTIPGGGTSEEHTTLLDIPLNNPFLCTRLSWLVIKIECTGEAIEEPVFFEVNESGSWCSPVAVLTIQSPVVYYSGRVQNQDGLPVVNAHVRFYRDDLEYTADTDEQGCFKARIERGYNRYYYHIAADGCADYDESWSAMYTEAKDTATLEFKLYDAIRFKKDEPATIILPVAPDPKLGRYYRLDRWDGEVNGEHHFYFEREESPHANVPYVVFPNHDFEVHPGDYNIKGIEPGSICISHPRGGRASVTFQGAYQSKILRCGHEDESLCFVFLTSDCSYAETEWGPSSQRGRIGAFRACFLMNCEWGGYISNPNSFIFSEGSTAIEPAVVYSTSDALFDLYGRQLRGASRKGVYIQGGKKYVK